MDQKLLNTRETKIKLFGELFNLYIENPIPEQLLTDFIDQIEDNDYNACNEVQDYICNNLKKQFSWSTAIGIMDSVEIIYNEAVANGNIKQVKNEDTYF